MIFRGARILTALALADHDQSWLQRTASLGVNTISRLVGDSRSKPAGSTLRTIARCLNVTEEWLTPDGAQRELTATEVAELRHYTRLLRALTTGRRFDARSEPNVRPEPARRVSAAFKRAGARSVYRVVGGSLAGLGVLDRDLVYVRPTTNIRTTVGSLVVVRLNGALYLKRLMVLQGGALNLLSAAHPYGPILIAPTDELCLVGTAVACMREYSKDRPTAMASLK